MEIYYEKIHKIIGRLTNAENFFIVLYDEKRMEVQFVYAVDESDPYLSADSIGILNQTDLSKTFTSYLLQKGEMVHLNEDEARELETAGVVETDGSPESVDWLGVPLIYEGELLGAMVIQSYRSDVIYNKKEENILQFVARQIALLIKSKFAADELKQVNLTLEKRVEERTQSLNEINVVMAQEIEDRKKSEEIQAVLFKITDLVSTTTSLEHFFKSVHLAISSLMYAKNLYIALLSDDKRFIEFVYFVDQRDTQPLKRPLTEESRKAGLTEQVLISGNALLFNRKKEDGSALSGSDCNSFIGVPLADNKRSFGVLAIQSYQKGIAYNDVDRKILVTIGKQIAIAILRKKDSDSLNAAHELLERRVKERTSELEHTIVKRRKIERQLEHDSLHDALTALPNRLYFSKYLRKKMTEHPSFKVEQFAVLFLDLDRFKLINDSLGHHIGDLFLIEVSNRLTLCLRENDLVARLGGDEFCILMNKITSRRTAINLATRILKELKSPILVGKHSLITSASIGIRLAKTNESSTDEIMSDADAAMYQAKHQGKNCFCLFDAEIKDMVTFRMEIENDLRLAISRQELYLVFQPIVNLATRKVEGCEALLRWQHPTRGLMPPDVFIPIAEETGIIIELGEFVAHEAAKFLIELAKNAPTKELFININVSAIQILSRTFDSTIRKLLETIKFDPYLLNVEITESILIEDYSAATDFVRELKVMGISIYLDDFGTGFSSLSYLHKFPFDVIKLDKSFIDAMEYDTKNLAIVGSIASMANDLQMKIVAEGIETKAQLANLSQFDYHYGQGYYFSKPLSKNDFVTFVKNS